MLGDQQAAALFNEELGAVLQVRHCDTDTVLETLREAGLGRHSHVIGTLRDDDRILFTYAGGTVLEQKRADLQRAWAQTSYRMQALRDNGTCGSLVVVHLGTNGGFSQDTLDQMLATLAEVPVVLLLTGKADRSWVAGNNAMVRALPASHPNVTVLDWEVVGGACGGCFYEDGIHLNQRGQDHYANSIGALIGR